MDEEAAFQATLDANPLDFTCRLVFADWLEEQDDPRADGMRALGKLRKNAAESWENGKRFDAQYSTYWFENERNSDFIPWRNLPPVWFAMLERDSGSQGRSIEYPNRRAAEDAAALAFGQLASIEQAALLAASLATPIPATL